MQTFCSSSLRTTREIIQLDIKKRIAPYHYIFSFVVFFRFLSSGSLLLLSHHLVYEPCAYTRPVSPSQISYSLSAITWNPESTLKTSVFQRTIHVHYVCGYFHATIAELSSCKRDHMTKKTEHICYFILIEKGSRIIPALKISLKPAS